MKTILALSLIAAAAAFVPTADATYQCDPVAGYLCVNSHTHGTCEQGSAANTVRFLRLGSDGYTMVSVGTACYGSPGNYAVGAVSASAASCDASFNCNTAGVFWVGGDYGGTEGCTSRAYVSVNGQYQPHTLPVCDVAGPPPVVPALLP